MSGAASGFDEALLPFLVCPISRTQLRYDRESGALIADAAGLAYPVRDGTPVLLPEAARRLEGDIHGGC